MKIAIAGAGAMGSRFGYMLHKDGNDVLLIDGWEDHVAAINRDGLKVKLDNNEDIVKISCSLLSKAEGDFDLIIVFTKSMMTEEVINSCKHLIQENTIVLTLQNGLGNVEIIEQYVSRSQLLAGVTTYATELLGPGKIQALGSGITEMMQVDGNVTNELNLIVETFNAAGINTKISPNVFSSIWTKVAFNAALNPLCTLMNNTVASVGSYSQIEDVVNGIINEILAVAKEEKVDLNREKILHMIYGVFDPAMSGHHLPSMLQDLLNGRKTEIDYLNGAIVKKAEKHGLSVPNNLLIYHLIKMLEENNLTRV